MIPTQRSVIARLRYRSLDGGWSEVSLYRATRIRVFPRNAVMERKILRAERNISSVSTPLINSAKQNSSMNVFWFSSSVKFVSAIFLGCDRWNEVYVRALSWFTYRSFRSVEWKVILMIRSLQKTVRTSSSGHTVPGFQKSFVVIQPNFELWCALCQAQVKRTGRISDFNDFSRYLSIARLTYDNLVYITGECHMHY